MRKIAIFTNQATLSYNGGTVNSNTVTGNIVEVLSATKIAVDNSYTANDDVTYIVSITNSGIAPLNNVTLTDNLGEYRFEEATLVPLDYVADSILYYQNGILQATPTVTATQPLTVAGITVPANGNVTLVYETRVNGFAPLTALSTITNEAVVTAQGITTPIIAEETISVSNEPILSISKSLSPTNVTENSQITYTFTIQNTGNTATAATDDVVILDTFDPILENITVTVDGVVVSEANYMYDEVTGAFSTATGVIIVPEATYVQDVNNGNWIVTPGVTVVTVTGTI